MGLHEFTDEQKLAVALGVGESVVKSIIVLETYVDGELTADSVGMLFDVAGATWSITVARSDD